MSDFELRGYFFGNMYLSQIQQGIQAAHVMQVMSKRYTKFHSSSAAFMFQQWMDEDRTMIVLNGGIQRDLMDLVLQLNSLTNHGSTYPMSYFEEEEDALNGTLTCVGIILPEYVYNYSPVVEHGIHVGVKDIQLYELIKSYKLA